MQRILFGLIFSILLIGCGTSKNGEDASSSKKLEVFKQVEISTKNALLNVNNSVVHFLNKNYAKKYNSKDNDDHFEIMKKARALHKNGNSLSAFKLICEIAKTDVSGKLYYFAGNVLNNLKRYSDSLNAYKLAYFLGVENGEKVAYNMACVYSLMRKRNECYRFLKTAIVLGYDNFNYIKRDSDLRWIRQDSHWKNWALSHLSYNSWQKFPLKKLKGSYLFKGFIQSSIKLGSTTKASRSSMGGMSVQFDERGALYFLMTNYHQPYPWGNAVEFCHYFKKAYIHTTRSEIKLISLKSQVEFISITGGSDSGKLKDFKIQAIDGDFGSAIKLGSRSDSDYMVSVMFKKKYKTSKGEKLLFLDNGKATLLGKEYTVDIQLDGNSPGDESIAFKEEVNGEEVWNRYIYEIRGNELLLFKVKGDVLDEKGKLAFKFKAF